MDSLVLNCSLCFFLKIQTPSQRVFKRPISNISSGGGNNSADDNDDLEERLLKRHQTVKRIKLVKELVNPQTGDRVTSSEYISAVRALFNHDKENRNFEEFKVLI